VCSKKTLKGKKKHHVYVRCVAASMTDIADRFTL
jgi:hypothetical protein